MRGWPTAVITAILGVGLALCALVKLIEDNEFQTRWAWVGFAIALFVMLVALLRVRHRWGMRGKSRREPTSVPSDRDAVAMLDGQHTGATRSRRGRFSGRAASRGRRSAS